MKEVLLIPAARAAARLGKVWLLEDAADERPCEPSRGPRSAISPLQRRCSSPGRAGSK